MFGRMDRVNQLLKEEVGKIIQKDLDNPAISFVTVTDVKTKPDLTEAKIFVSIMADDKRKEATLSALNKARSYIKKLIAGRIKLKFMPDLKFFQDKSIDKSIRIEELFKKIEEEGDHNEP
jgi:ribosome-binding factor A